MNGRRLLLWAAALSFTLALSCNGLLVDKGNAYPCDFDQPEGERDLACSPGWVCGVTDLCHRYTDEGPQFSGPAPLPLFDGGLLSPTSLRGPVRAVLPDLADPRSGLLVLGQGKSGAELWQLLPSGDTVYLGEGSPTLVGGFSSGGFGLAFDSDGRVSSFTGGAMKVYPGLDGVHGLRPSRSEPTVVVLRSGALEAVELSLDGGSLPRPLKVALSNPDAGPLGPERSTVREARWLPRVYFGSLAIPGTTGRPEALVAVTQKSFYWRNEKGPTGGAEWALLNSDEDLDLLPASMRHDRNGTLWAVAGARLKFDGTPLLLPQVLSTWTLNRASLGTPASVQRAWDDCFPCGLTGRIITFTPSSRNGAAVEVLCEASGGKGRSLLQVTGTQLPGDIGACQAEQLDEPVAFSNLTSIDAPLGRRYALDHTLGGSVVMGGNAGELWGADLLSDLTPRYLDRVPRSVGTLDLPGGAKRQPVAIADRYLAAARGDAGFVSFRIQDFSDTVQGTGAVPRVAVGEANGWQVLSTGDVVKVRPNDGGTDFSLSFGGRLVDGRGEPAREPYFAEGLLRDDGSVASVVLTADDSLYHYDSTVAFEQTANVLPPITPRLTPEPSFPIRAMALDRASTGADGGPVVHGYLVTSRNLYEYALSGQPARWSAEPIVLSGGEPVAVWMDGPASTLGRVGYRDGTVFTLPGGFPLVQALPRGEADGGTDQVLDYENLGGWPVAFAESGLYLAAWDALPDGSLARTLSDGGPGKAMSWRKVTLPDGSAPWVGGGGKLKVFRHPGAISGGQRQTRYELWLFGERGRVYSVGTLVRSDPAL